MKTTIIFFTVLLSFITGYTQSLVNNEQPKLIFYYDNAGNQKTRVFCNDGNSCNAFLQETEAQLVKTEELEEALNKKLDRSIAVYPNPTKGNLIINWDQKFNAQIDDIVIIDITSRVYKTNYKSIDSKTSIDLSSWPNGLYVLRFYLEGGVIVNKKIIKN